MTFGHMIFAQIGEQLQQRFREYLKENLYQALQWRIEQFATPVGVEGGSQTFYRELMGISAFEPHPKSTTQLSLGYTITQEAFIHPDEAAKLGTRALTERKPAQFSNRWVESLNLSEHGCFHSGPELVYTINFDSGRGFPHDEGRSKVGQYGHPSLVEGDKYFSIADKGNRFPSEIKRIEEILSKPDEVLEVFVERWLRGK